MIRASISTFSSENVFCWTRCVGDCYRNQDLTLASSVFENGFMMTARIDLLCACSIRIPIANLREISTIFINKGSI